MTAFSVVLATLVLQGLTLAPIARLLKLDRTDDAMRELASARVVLAEVALTSIEDQQGPEADNLRYRLTLDLQKCMCETERRIFKPASRPRIEGDRS